MILVDTQIREAIEDGHVKLEPFAETQVQPASYDLRVGSQGISTSSNGVMDVSRKGFFDLHPGDFGILVTQELIEFDDRHAARIGLRSKYARKGIIATTGPQVDPGFKGRLKIGITNLSPHAVAFPYEDDFITLEIHRLSQPVAEPYSGPYQGVERLSPDDIAAVTEGDNIGFAKMLDSLRSLSRNVAELTENVNRFTTQNESIQQQNKHVLWGLGVGLAVIALLIAFK